MKKLFYIFCFFPFVKWFGIGGSSDTQSYAMVLSACLILFYGYKQKLVLSRRMINFYGWILFGLAAGYIAAIAQSGFEFSKSIRYLATYISIIIISYLSYFYCSKENGVDEKMVKLAINTYLVVGVVQRFISSQFCYAIVANGRTTGNRGVISLASEPSFYGYMCIFFLILVLDFKNQKGFYISNLLVQIFFLSKSSITILYLMIFLGIYLIYTLWNIKRKQLLIGAAGVLVVSGVLYYMVKSDSNQGQRIVFFIQAIFSNHSIRDVLDSLTSDVSVSIRFNDIITCIQGFLSRAGIPYGFGTRKISSGYGSLLLTMGWIGVVAEISVYRFCKDAYKDYRKTVLPIFLTIIMFSAIQLSNPLFCFLIGYFMYRVKQNQKAGEEDTERVTWREEK